MATMRRDPPFRPVATRDLATRNAKRTIEEVDAARIHGASESTTRTHRHCEVGMGTMIRTAHPHEDATKT